MRPRTQDLGCANGTDSRLGNESGSERIDQLDEISFIGDSFDVERFRATCDRAQVCR